MAEWVGWIGRIGVAQVVMRALQVDFKQGEQHAFDYMRRLSREEV